MKRSEMLRLMWEFVQTVETDYDEYMSEKDMDTLLTLMEYKGMRPPLNKIISGTSKEAFLAIQEYKNALEWEPE